MFPNKTLAKIVALFLIAIQFTYVFFFRLPGQAFALVPSFQTANDTLTNSRLSFRSMISTTTGTSASNFVISGSPTAPATDADTNNLFPQDQVCFNNPSSNGCASQTTYAINSTPSSTQFATGTTVANAITAGTNAVATQSGQMVITFTPTTSVASGGFIRLTIPDTASSNADGMPDNSGFDAAALPANLLAGTCASNVCLAFTGFTASAASLTTTGGASSVVLITLSSALTAGNSYSFTLGHASTASLRFQNPSPASSGHTRGLADTYSITLQSEDSSNNPQDKTIMKVAPVDGVLVSATIEETITYTISGVSGGSSACGQTTVSTASTATTIPFGSIIASNTFYDQAQSHAVITNAANGFTLTAQQNQALSLNGLGVTTISNTSCNGATCSAGSSGNVCTPGTWSTTSVNGFGYTLANINGSDASFTNASGYCPFTTVPNKIMSKNSPTAVSPGDSIYVCPRVNVSASQQTGTYLNNLTFIATPKF